MASFDNPPLSDKLLRLLGEPSLYDSPRQHQHHQHRILRNAMSVTKGVFNKPSTSRIPLRVDSPSLPSTVERRRIIRKSTSVPSLKLQNANAGPSPSHIPFEDLYPPLPSFRPKQSSLSPKGVSKSKKEPKSSLPSVRARRIPHISSPSLPKAFDCIDFNSNPKLAHPLSSMPISAQLNAPPIPQMATAAIPSGTPPAQGSTSDDAAGAASSDFLDGTPGGIRLVRRRTKSASGIKLTKRAPFMPALTTPGGHDRSENIDDDPIIVIDISSPSIQSSVSGYTSSSSPSAGASGGSAEGYFQETSPVIDIASPKSFTSVKRKPVPRYLYTDPPGHDASAPTTPTLTMTPPTQLPPALPPLPTPNLLQTHLLPSSELIVKSCNPPRPSERGLSLLPIGQDGTASARRRHRRSVSANAIDQLLPSPTKSLGLPSPWYTANANGSMTALVTPAEEQPVFSFAHDLPAPPRVSLHPPPQTPPRVIFDATSSYSAASLEVSGPSASTSKGAMSPLTDDEIDAIRNFLDHNVTGARAQQRRKLTAAVAVAIPHEGRSRSASNVSAAYDMHAQIFDAYASEDDEFHSFAGSASEEEEEETAVPTWRKQPTAITTQTGMSPAAEQPESYFDVETPIMRQDEDEVATPMDMVNRGTFGYYHPLIHQPLFEDDASDDVGDRSAEVRQSLDADWEPTGAAGDKSRSHSAVDMEDFGTPGPLEGAGDRRTSTQRTSSVYYTVESSSGYASHDDDADLPYLRSSRQPLISRFSMSSDSESERPVSSSSASGSVSTTRSFNPQPFVGGFSGGIGLAILPPEQIAYFERFDRLQHRSPSTQADAGEESPEGSPDTISHATPKTVQRRRFEMKNSTAFDRMRDEFESSLRDSTPGSPIQFATQYQATLLRPALHINPKLAATCSSRTVLPSPTDTISTYPPRTLREVPIRGHTGQKRPEHTKTKSQAFNASSSADEALRDNLRSFMNLTPTGKEKEGGASASDASKKGKVRLRQLFSRTNLRGQAKKDAEMRP